MGFTIPADHIPLRQTEFRGFYNRGLADDCPDSYQGQALNCKFAEGNIATRDGLQLAIAKSNIVRFWTYRRLNETPRSIILDTSGNLLDSLAIGTPIWTDASITDFSLVNYGNRAYITVHNRIKGLPSKSILVYEGSGSARLAGGIAPTGFTLTAADGAAGSVEAGYHLLAVAGITSSGFITAPGPAAFTLYNAPGAKKINIGNIPVLVGTQWVGRVLLATKSIPTTLYNGNQFGYELFFIPGGTILDNVTTSLTVDFFDASLQQSADYLLDNLSTIPAGVGIGVYSNRLITWGENGNEFTVRVSEAGQPEVFSSVSGFVNIDPTDAISGIKNCAAARGNQLLILTSNRIYSTTDNGSDPNTWKVGDAIDTSAGTECFGVATTLNARTNNVDRTWIITLGGLIAYEGMVKRPELTYNIEDTWGQINKAALNTMQVIDDPTNHRLFITAPIGGVGVTTPNNVLYGDYSKAFTVYGTIDEKLIKWSLWSFPSNPISIVGDTLTTGASVFRVALSSGNIYDLTPGVTTDFSNAIQWQVNLAPKTAAAGWINHFSWLKMRIKGTGSLLVKTRNLDATGNTVYSPITLATSPGKWFDVILNTQNEKCTVILNLVNAGENATLSEVILEAKPLWYDRAG